MNTYTKTLLLSAFFLLCSGLIAPVWSQDGVATSQGLKAVPGTITQITPFINYSETYQWSDLPEVLGEDASFDWAADLLFAREIWCLEFSFKKPRLIEVDFPNEAGRLERKLVWYMVYSVTNTGKCLSREIETPADTKVQVLVKKEPGKLEVKEYDQIFNNVEGTYRPKWVDYNGQPAGEDGSVPGSVRFVPQFVLVSPAVQNPVEYAKDEGGLVVPNPVATEQVKYYDEYLPLAFVKIAAQEDPQQSFQTTVTIASVDIKPGETVWGIATWLDVDRETGIAKSLDPRIDRFSIYVSGLTNAQKWENAPEAYTPGAELLSGRNVSRKVLKLNFYRPGDEFDQKSKEIYFGQPGELDYQWIYL
ncbi:MAG: hypothetical protein Q4G68_03490 [Planctomycetia bacterium]|nr:hypothetical protein [Planctomycetia bacterium]